jgi:polyhydroxyalkanoate synthase
MTDFEGNPFFGRLFSDPDALAHNLAGAFAEAGRAASLWLGPRSTGETPHDATEDLARILRTVARVAEWWLSEPDRGRARRDRLYADWIALIEATNRRLAGEAVEPVIEPAADDRRFRDPQWRENAFFDFLKQVYLLTARWATGLVEDADELDDHTRGQARFWVRQIVSALSPSNFVATNPQVLRDTVASSGANLARGMRMLAEDIVAGGGDLKIRQSDHSKFEIGGNLAITPGAVIFQNDLCQVIQYAPTTATVRRRPLLIVPPWINKYYVLDLAPEKSLVRWAVAEGLTVFVISWVDPDRRLAEKTFEDYMRDGITAALDAVETATGETEIDAVGYCVGGTLLAVALAHAAATGRERIRSATFFATQVDFSDPGELSVFIDEEQIAALEAQMRRVGFLDGRITATAFNLLRENELIWPYVVDVYLRGQEPFPFDLLYWNADSTRLPAANHAWYLRNCYLDDALARGEMEIGGVRLDLGRVRIPVYDLAAREDHIAPARSVFAGCRLFGGPVEFVLAGSGHIAGVINPPERRKYRFWTGGAPTGDFADWLAGATETAGSWWPHWRAWLERLSADRVPAREPGGGRLPPLEPAPGSYVRARG